MSERERGELWAGLADLRMAGASRLFDRKGIPGGLASLAGSARLGRER